MMTQNDLSDESRRDLTPVQSRQPRKLSPQERATLRHCENSIQKALQTFAEAGDALKTIRNQRLYREKFSSFRGYCRARWGFEASRARQLIAAGDVFKDVVDVTDIKPVNEAQLRPLSGLDTATRRLVWQKATEKEAQPTESAVKAAVREFVPAEAEHREMAVADMAALIEHMLVRMDETIRTVNNWNYKVGLNSEQRADLHRMIERVRDAMRDVAGQL